MAVDATKPQDGPLYFFSGLEYSFMNMFALRGGYKFNYSGTSETPGRDTAPVQQRGLDPRSWRRTGAMRVEA